MWGSFVRLVEKAFANEDFAEDLIPRKRVEFCPDWLWRLIFKYRQMIVYVFFGCCAVGVNALTYMAVYQDGYLLANVPSTVIAWVVATTFAYFTNSFITFKSDTRGVKNRMREYAKFSGCRLATCLIEVAIMFVTVDVLGWMAILWKFIATAVSSIINYVASKLLIFRKK